MIRKNKSLLRCVALLVAFTFIVGLASCGTIIYPERRGQTSGRIDVGVALLDGLGLLLFIIPGVIAFAVDFSTGAIYLPPGTSKMALASADLENAQVIQTSPNNLTRSDIESLVSEKTEAKINLALPNTKVAKVTSDQPLVWGNIAEVLTEEELVVFENHNS